ncbi:MAG: hypothetical protein H5T86_02905 [Armatimonadetes bacterium]|nr:hypothetical protein [Armatimonadota bacterium]
MMSCPEDGEQEVASLSRLESSEALAACAAIARRLDAEVQAAIARLVHHAAELAVCAAESLMGSHAQAARWALEKALKEALASAVGAVKLQVVVHPSQLDIATQLAEVLARSFQVSIEADEHVAPGGCIVSTDLGEVDATVESRVRRLREAIEEEPLG